ncbi:hypothetical protein N431DRAFT_142168 [Stipitochalara longipes BDJ]|nr:hypothetical protein N431DRAFT_142168 [Stipitochalara longipes BDJ]
MADSGDTDKNPFLSRPVPHYTEMPPPVTVPARLEDSLRSRLGHLMLPQHPRDMATPDFHRESHTKRVSSSEQRTCPENTESERPNKRRVPGECNGQMSSNNRYISPSKHPQTHGACPLDIGARREIDTPSHEGETQVEFRQEDSLLGDISWRTAPYAEGEDMIQLILLAETAEKQDYIGFMPPFGDARMLERAAATQNANLPALMTPSPSGSSDVNILESGLIPEKHSGDAHNLTPPMSRSNTGSSKSSEDISHDIQQLDLAPAQETQEENRPAAEQRILAAPTIAYKHPDDNDKIIEAAQILCGFLTLKREEEALAQKQDAPSVPSALGNVHSRLGRNDKYAGQFRSRLSGIPVKDLSLEQFHSVLDQSTDDSDADTEDDPQWIGYSQ